MKRRAKIVCTLGPATSSPERVRELVRAGMDVARLNLSHGSREDHAAVYREVRAASDEAGRAVAVLVDLQGPKIRLGTFKDGAAMLETGATFDITTAPCPDGDAKRAGTTYEALARDVTVGDTVLIDDGRVRLRVEETDGTTVRLTVLEGGRISNHKGINLPGVRVSAPCMSEKDREDLRFALSLRVDLIALSFVREPSDLAEVHAVMDECGARLPVIAKIEKPEAVDRLGPIVRAFDGLMVARGDLGVEMGQAALTGLQKTIIRETRMRNRVAITATQMMESMIDSPIPTRAEVSDVANAVLDGTDAVMLSAETATGKYPVQTVAAMARICVEAEKEDTLHTEGRRREPPQNVEEAIARATVITANTLPIKAIAALTQSGRTVLLMSRAQSRVPIYAMSSVVETRRRVTLFSGVYPVKFKGVRDPERALRLAEDELLKRGAVQNGDTIVLTIGEPYGKAGGTNTMKIVKVGEHREDKPA